jgi:hypothetical protein
VGLLFVLLVKLLLLEVGAPLLSVVVVIVALLVGLLFVLLVKLLFDVKLAMVVKMLMLLLLGGKGSGAVVVHLLFLHGGGQKLVVDYRVQCIHAYIHMLHILVLSVCMQVRVVFAGILL